MVNIDLILPKFGFSDKEARVYLALLQLGTGLVSEVSKKARINRSTTYVMLEELSKRGLVSISERKNNRIYNAAPPERLIQILEEKVQRDTELVGLARTLLPELKSLYVGVGPKPKVRFYEGAEGIESVYEDTLTSTEAIRAYASIENMHATLPHYFPAYYKRRAGKGIHIQSIHPDTVEARERVRHDQDESRTSALVPREKYDFSPEINIYGNKIAFMSLKEKFGLIIESQELADAFKKVFDLSWEEAKREDRKIRRQSS